MEQSPNHNEEVIKKFLTNISKQDNRATAFPYYYVIRTEVEESAPVESCDFTRWYYMDSSYDSFEEIEQMLKDDGCSEDEIKAARREAHEYGVKKRWDERGMFLTETDAIDHLKANKHHYSHNAHNYLKHAWRAPELTEFFTSLFAHFNIQKPSN